jgi:hypothetical protein
MGELIVLAEHREAKRRRAAKRAAAVSCEVLVQTGFLAAFAWLNAMEDAAELFLVPWPGGIDDLPI